MAIDRKLVQSAYYYLAAAVCTLFGLMHSPLPNSPIRLPFAIPGVPDSLVLPAEVQGQMFSWFAGYVLVAILLLLWALYLKRSGQTQPDGHAELEQM